MAKYENEGNCPNNSFIRINLNGFVDPDKVEEILEIVDDRTAFMVYDKKMTTWGASPESIVELLLQDRNGEQIALTLKRMIPVCKYPEIGRKILIRDVINPTYIPGVYNLQNNEFSFKNENGELNVYYPVFSENEGKKVLFYSDKFVTVVEDEGDQVVVWIYRYPNAR